MIETPQVVETPVQLVARIHIETSRSKIQHVMGPGIDEAMADAVTFKFLSAPLTREQIADLIQLPGN